MALDRKILSIMDRSKKNPQSGTAGHPLAQASMALQAHLGAAKQNHVRTGGLVNLLLTHAARSRRRAQDRVIVRMRVLKPNGRAAIRLKV